MNKSTLLCVPIFVIGMLGTTSVIGQNEVDALRISTLEPGGTARSNGMANAFGALGADGAGIGINPAGYGLYRNTELSLTPSLEVNDALSTYYSGTSTDSKAKAYFNNLSLVINKPNDKGGEWRSSSFGVTYDRQQTNHFSKQALSINVPSTILQRFVNEASGSSIDDLNGDGFPFSSSLAWYTFGIDPAVSANGDTIPNEYAGAIPFGSLTEQVNTVASRGANKNTSFFWAGNYLDRLYIGLSVGIAGHKFNRTTKHTETTLDETLDLKDVTYTEELNTSGNGIGFKVGVLGRVTERLRMGVAFHSPQWMRLNDVFLYDMTTNFRTVDANGASSYTETSPDGAFSYRVRTPWRAVASAAYIAGKAGAFNIDYEYVDYTKMRFTRNDQLVNSYDFRIENEAIQLSYRAVHSFRVGTEIRSGNWYYRLGWGYLPDAYVKTDPRSGKDQLTYAAGIGYRTDHIGVDLGLNYVKRSTITYPYDADLVDPIQEQLTNYRAMATVSFRP